MTVTIGGQPCSGVTVTDALALTQFVCTAPTGPGVGDVRLQVTVADSGNASTPFLYSAPAVTGVSPSPCNAEATCPLVLTGSNLGLKNSITSPEPVVTLGDVPCSQPIVVDSSRVLCTAPAGVVVGRYPVVLSLNGQNSSGSVALDRLCGDGRYGPRGSLCGPCPPNANCITMFPVPLPLPGV